MSTDLINETQVATSGTGRVITRFGAELLIQCEDKTPLRCTTKRKLDGAGLQPATCTSTLSTISQYLFSRLPVRNHTILSCHIARENVSINDIKHSTLKPLSLYGLQ